MASILTNYSAMTALQTLRGVNNNLGETQARISTGLKVRSGKDNAAYFNISSTMRGDSGMFKSINEGLSLTRNSLATARAGAEQFVSIATEFVERLAFAQGDSLDHKDVLKELSELVGRMDTVVQQATFNGDNLIDAENGDGGTERTVVTGVTRVPDATDPAVKFNVTTITFHEVDLVGIRDAFSDIVAVKDGTGTLTGGLELDLDGTPANDQPLLAAALQEAETQLKAAIDAATDLGIAEKSIEVQQNFLATLTDEIDGGIGAMIDANMEQEASRLQALQVQQQLATQSLSIANQNPHNILALFR